MIKKSVAVAFLILLCGSIAVIGTETKLANAEPSPVIIDSNPVVTSSGILLSSTTGTGGTYSAVGQSFNTTITARLTSCKFIMLRIGSPTVNLTAYLYATTGTYGTNSMPTGTPLATSDQLNASTLLAAGNAWYQFNFTGAYILQAGQKYCIEISIQGSGGFVNLANCPRVAYGAFGHAGNGNYYCFSAWNPDAVLDIAFYVYGEPLPPPVGGEWIPINTLQMLAQIIGSAAVMSAIAASFIGFKRIKKKQN